MLALMGELGGLEKLPQLLTESSNPSRLIASVETAIGRLWGSHEEFCKICQFILNIFLIYKYLKYRFTFFKCGSWECLLSSLLE